MVLCRFFFLREISDGRRRPVYDAGVSSKKWKMGRVCLCAPDANVYQGRGGKYQLGQVGKPNCGVPPGQERGGTLLGLLRPFEFNNACAETSASGSGGAS